MPIETEKDVVRIINKIFNVIEEEDISDYEAFVVLSSAANAINICSDDMPKGESWEPTSI